MTKTVPARHGQPNVRGAQNVDTGGDGLPRTPTTEDKHSLVLVSLSHVGNQCPIIVRRNGDAAEKRQHNRIDCDVGICLQHVKHNEGADQVNGFAKKTTLALRCGGYKK